MLDFLAPIKAKMYAVASFIGLIMFGWIKYLRAENKQLEHKNKVHDKINEIKEDQDEITEEILKHEDERIKERVKANSGKSRRDRAGRL